MKKVYLYVCDGEKPDCEKTACAWHGNGSCTHTADKRHARYGEPRKWAFEAREPEKHVFAERISDEDMTGEE